MTTRAVILGCAGPRLTPSERAFFASARPWGFILFARNVETPDQLRALTADLRACVGRDAPILIDQEGGRVARMRAPAWREWLPALDECARLSTLALRAHAMRLRYRLIATELAAVGVDVNCAPVLDVVHPQTHAAIRNRAYGADPSEVAAIGRAVATGLLAGGVLPVAKHAPGQGRASLDSHLDLPRVEADRTALAADFAPFRSLADLPMAMTAHVVYAAIDPRSPATQSRAMVELIRADIGFDGLLITDDLSMQALSGDFSDRVRRSVSAGCDMVLHCNGDPREAAAVAEAAPVLAGRAEARASAALAMRGRTADADPAALAAEYADLARAARA